MSDTRRRKIPASRRAKGDYGKGLDGRPSETQLAEMRDQDIRTIVRLYQVWLDIDDVAAGRVWPTNLSADKTHAERAIDCSEPGEDPDMVPATSVEALALLEHNAQKWQTGFESLRAMLRRLESAAPHIAIPAVKRSKSGKPRRDSQGNLMPVETCGKPECGLPLVDREGRSIPVRRIDGVPYHAKSCWYSVWKTTPQGIATLHGLNELAGEDEQAHPADGQEVA